MKAIIIKKRKILFFPVPKVATCSLKHLCLRLDNKYSKTNYRLDINLCHVNNFLLKTKYKNFFKFTFVRNPLDRLISAFENKIKKDKNINNRSFKNGIFIPWHRYNFHVGMNFKKFAKIIYKIPDKISNNHFCSQYNILPLNKLNFIGKFENIQNDVKYICKKYDIHDFKLPHLLKSDRKPFHEYYNEKFENSIKKRYKKDIKIFNY